MLEPTFKKDRMIVLATVGLVASSVFLGSVLSGPVFAQSLLCLEEKSTGFNWRDGQWVQVEFLLDKYVLNKKGSDHADFRFCAGRIVAKNGSFEKVPFGVDNMASYACYEIKKVGQESFGLNDCIETYDKTGEKLLAVSCDGGTSYNAIIDGEFFHTTTYSGGNLYWQDMTEKDSLVMSVGSCSRID